MEAYFQETEDEISMEVGKIVVTGVTQEDVHSTIFYVLL